MPRWLCSHQVELKMSRMPFVITVKSTQNSGITARIVARVT
jgi:hypothetical protein